MKGTILVFCDWFVPGYRAGGPIRSVENFARFMSVGYKVFIVTADRDHGSTEPYPHIQTGVWTAFAPNIAVNYLAPGEQTKATFSSIIQEVQPGFIYLNSMFSKSFTLLPLMAGKKQPGVKLVLAPRGMLKASALAFKPFKKKLFLAFSKITGLFRNVHFHATDEQEVLDIQRHFGKKIPAQLAGNLPVTPDAAITPLAKETGSIRIIFTGRIHPIKNLHLLLACLRDVKAQVDCTLIGVMEDAAYWAQCRQVIGTLPANIRITGPQELNHDQLYAITRQHHLFVLPTQGENFGHAIFEALCCGRPVLISDQTPWKQLAEKKAGWDLPLASTPAFTETIEKVAAMPAAEWESWCAGAHRLAVSVYSNAAVQEKYYQLFS